MEGALFVAALVNQLLFFSVLSIIGQQYSGVNDSLSYVLFCIVTGVLSLLYIIKSTLPLRCLSFSRGVLLFSFLPLVISIIFFIEQPSSDLAETYFTYYLLWGLTATYIGIFVARMELIALIAKWFEVIMIFFTISVILSIVLPFYKSVKFISLSGATYQTASYISAFAYTLNLFYILFGTEYKLFKFHYSNIYRIFAFCLLPIQVLGVFITGGRGGFVLVFVATILMLLTNRRNQKFSLQKRVGIIALLLITSLLIIPRLNQKALFASGFQRIFSYVTPEGIDMSQTSNRDTFYSNAIELIYEKPLFGYGLFKNFDNGFYPHNLFLEILLNGGVLYMILIVIIGGLFIRKFILVIKNDALNFVMLPLFLYPIIMLMFSGTYLTTSLFWFGISYVFCYKLKNRVDDVEQ